ncbi:MAG: 3'-5' exonuclease [Kineosporiaceae bacterium]|nr:3'-5' exonuclease [Kineosporiaceae bacterium]
MLSRFSRRPAVATVPGWDSLERPWREAEFCVVDLEATGLDLRQDEIVSYGAVIVRAGRIVANSCRYGLVKPTRPVSEGALIVHALSAAELVDAPPLSACAEVLAELMQGRALVAHAAWVERAFLKRAFATRGLRLDGPIVDTAALARELYLAPRAPGSTEPSLERLAVDLGLPVHPPHHALGDALTTAQLLLAFATKLEAQGPQTVRSLTEISRRRVLH